MASLLKPYTRLTRASCSTLVMFGLLLVVAPHVFVHAEWKFLSAFSPSRCPRFSSQSYQSLMSGLLANNTNKCELGIFAQDMPLHTISLAISEFLARPQASKPLTLVLAGPNGVGKTMTERRLRDILHKKTIWSDARKGFQVFNGGHVGDSNPSYLVEAIGKQIKDCPTSIIVIDELQFLPVPTIEALAIFFDSAQPVRVSPTLNVDASKSIFLFTTNSMFALINARTKSLLKTKKRNELKYFDFEDILKQGFAESSTSWLSYKNLMDYYIPLLPVTLEDAKQFISKLLKHLGCTGKSSGLFASLKWDSSVVDLVASKLILDSDGFVENGFGRIEVPVFAELVRGPILAATPTTYPHSKETCVLSVKKGNVEVAFHAMPKPKSDL
eukprot:m.51990 g.51990  ORF g.51990 m.51990 type:complete len:385 (+) comp11276_c0_seq2:129-1283(+)